MVNKTHDIIFSQDVNIAFASIPKLKYNTQQNARVYIQEKVDGSQMGFYLNDAGDMVFCNKNGILPLDSQVYEKSLLTLPEIKHKLDTGYIYYGEHLRSSRANIMPYSRVPLFYFILFDVYDVAAGHYLQHPEMRQHAHELGLESVPLLGVWNACDGLREFCRSLMQQVEKGGNHKLFGWADRRNCCKVR